ncbi:acyl-(acyl-carrier-protein)--UDP-N-acetylglucosamine O-acyltransferase [Leptolyngbyaceae cyanobacterium JSC-12]|nr:acyl-(acyl-carrier-protein)--UDP-N-acetylglucosamine O-acyltransferase [Leptolyngbyaceae cyanobacterium JSC-12]
MAIHPTAVIEPGAELGDNVTVGAFSYIEPDVKIGDRCVIGPHVTILRYTQLGAGCRVHPGAVLGDLPQDLAFQNDITHVRIGSNCVIREGVTIHRGTRAGSITQVGDDCLLMAQSHLAHNVKLGNQVIVANGALLAGYVEVGDRAFISGNCLVHQFTRVGRLAMMSGASAVQKDILPFCITRSVSPNTIMGLNIVGLRRAGFSASDRRILKQALGVLYNSGLNTSQAIEKLEAEFESELVKEWCEFIRSSKRGICKFFKRSNRSEDRDEDKTNDDGIIE